MYATAEIMLTIVPPPCSNICGRTARVRASCASTLPSNTQAQVVLVGVEELLGLDRALVDAVVDEAVEATEPRDRGVDRVEQGLAVEDVEPDREARRALGFDRGDGRVEAAGHDDGIVGLVAAVAVVHRPGADDDVEARAGPGGSRTPCRSRGWPR